MIFEEEIASKLPKGYLSKNLYSLKKSKQHEPYVLFLNEQFVLNIYLKEKVERDFFYFYWDKFIVRIWLRLFF